MFEYVFYKKKSIPEKAKKYRNFVVFYDFEISAFLGGFEGVIFYINCVLSICILVSYMIFEINKKRVLLIHATIPV